MKAPWTRQREGGYRGIEMIAKIIYHVVASLHGAHWRIQHRTTRIAKGFPRLQMGLFTHYTLAFDFLHFAIGVGDYPMSIQ